MTYSINVAEANSIAAKVVAQSPHAPVDYLIEAALKGHFGQGIMDVLECSDDYTEELEDALNARGAVEYHVKELLTR